MKLNKEYLFTVYKLSVTMWFALYYIYIFVAIAIDSRAKSIYGSINQQ